MQMLDDDTCRELRALNDDLVALKECADHNAGYLRTNGQNESVENAGGAAAIGYVLLRSVAHRGHGNDNEGGEVMATAADVTITVVGERLTLEELLRDLFAAASLAGLNADPERSTLTPEKAASWAYEDADAMLAERRKGAK